MIIWCIVFLYTSRIFAYFHIPSIINFAHFGFLLIAIIMGLSQSIITTKRSMIIPALALALLISFSGIVNLVAPFNILLTFLIIAEPFIIAHFSLSWEDSTYINIENIILVLSFFNLIISYFQYFVLGYIDDAVTGIFLQMGSGAHLNGAFAMGVGAYVLYRIFVCDSRHKIAGIIYSILQFGVIILADNKQSLLGFAMGAIILLFLNAKDVKQTFKTIFLLILGATVVYYFTFSLLEKISTWTSDTSEMLLGVKAKFSFIEYLKNLRTSPLQVIFGFGPGMTLSRVARILPDYSSVGFWGITISNITAFFKSIYSNSWIMISSSIWTFYFSWASFYGDLGIAGVIAVFMLYISFYKNFCRKTMAKYFWAVVISHGFIFDWLEEPSFVVAYFLLIILINSDVDKVKSQKRLLYMFLK